jgi:hypothetical protein
VVEQRDEQRQAGRMVSVGYVRGADGKPLVVDVAEVKPRRIKGRLGIRG